MTMACIAELLPGFLPLDPGGQSPYPDTGVVRAPGGGCGGSHFRSQQPATSDYGAPGRTMRHSLWDGKVCGQVRRRYVAQERHGVPWQEVETNVGDFHEREGREEPDDSLSASGLYNLRSALDE
ncbi:Uncharacterised protein [Mycobacterium xenopi]|uniref:Uncharacterized protein n=1 Tax=Mycobacterium xenopi TaxID=1789 RepID=A0AAD1M0B2_MYCXE|nr:hypothetical protein MYXE_10540 [Mycobacterium xenopi]SPX78843.1 Uncharacterised protein [Mycobacterium xenopi]